MPDIILRKLVVQVEEATNDGEPLKSEALHRAAVVAVIANPFAGRSVEDIQGFMHDLTPLGLVMAERLLAALGGNPTLVEGYGKGGIVGRAGDPTHVAAWNEPGGDAIRDVLGATPPNMPSIKKLGGPGTRLNVPITPVDAADMSHHFDAIEVGLADAPRAAELVLVLAMSTGPRAQAGGLMASDRQGRERPAMNADVRRIVTVVEETFIEGGRAVDPPTRRATATAVIRNPCVGAFAEDLSDLATIGEELGALLPARAIAALGIPGNRVESFGKAALVGEDGELEHAAAILHPKLGAPFREALGGGAALIPSSKKRGGIGAPFDVPLGHKDAARVRSHFDGIEVRLSDGPRADEIAIAIAVTDSGRPHPRVGGLTKDQIEGKDGVR